MKKSRSSKKQAELGKRRRRLAPFATMTLARAIAAIFVAVICLAAGSSSKSVAAANPVASPLPQKHYKATRPIVVDRQTGQLRMPAINPDLTHKVKAPDDLTFELLRDVGWTFPDAAGDGVADDEDCNPNSDLRPTIIIGTIDTGVPNTLFSGGCTSSDLIAQLAASAGNHGNFVSAVANLTDQWVRSGLITGQQKGAIESAAARYRGV